MVILLNSVVGDNKLFQDKMSFKSPKKMIKNEIRSSLFIVMKFLTLSLHMI